MNLNRGEAITVTLVGNEKAIHATFLGWIPHSHTYSHSFLLVECDGQERKIHDIFIGEINGELFTT